MLGSIYQTQIVLYFNMRLQYYTSLIVQVVWHPGSVYDNYLVVLTSDNFLRIYDLENLDEGSVKAEQVKKTLLLNKIDRSRSSGSLITVQDLQNDLQFKVVLNVLGGILCLQQSAKISKFEFGTRMNILL